MTNQLSSVADEEVSDALTIKLTQLAVQYVERTGKFFTYGPTLRLTPDGWSVTVYLDRHMNVRVTVDKAKTWEEALATLESRLNEDRTQELSALQGARGSLVSSLELVKECPNFSSKILDDMQKLADDMQAVINDINKDIEG